MQMAVTSRFNSILFDIQPISRFAHAMQAVHILLLLLFYNNIIL